MDALVTLTPANRAALAKAVADYEVLYEAGPAQEAAGEEVRSIGFDVTLTGTHTHEGPHVGLPGCSACGAVYEALQRIARAVVPPPGRASGYEVRGFDFALHMDPRRGLRSYVELELTIRHREGYHDPIDACERTCLAEICRGLEALGAHEAKG